MKKYNKKTTKFQLFQVSILVLLFLQPHVLFSQPKISVVEGKKFDFGVVDEGDTVVKRLTLKNIGKDTLRIKSVQTSCGCTIAQPATKILPPKKSTSFVVSFRTKGLAGPVKKNIYVFSNDKKDSIYTLAILANVRRVIEAEPSYINFNTVSFDTMTKRTVILRNTSDKKVQIYSVTCPDSQITPDLRSYIIEPKDSTTLIVGLKPKVTGKILGEIAVETNNSRQLNFTISYIAYCK